jgi:signal transduction histidine kinase
LQLFRLAQEFIQNSGRHGHATEVSIKVFEDNTGLYLEFEDNGIGYNPNEVKRGLGTQGAEQRVQILGGSMQIIAENGKGVRWVITIPKFSSLQTLVPVS